LLAFGTDAPGIETDAMVDVMEDVIMRDFSAPLLLDSPEASLPDLANENVDVDVRSSTLLMPPARNSSAFLKRDIVLVTA
jgi:hypothetical protein